MPTLDILKQYLRHPISIIASFLENPPNASLIFWRFTLPLISLRPLAILFKGIQQNQSRAACIEAMGEFIILLIITLCLLLVLTPLAAQFNVCISHQQAWVLGNAALFFFWISGLLYALPQQQLWVFLWIRTSIFIWSMGGAFLLYHALPLIQCTAKIRFSLVTAIVAIVFSLYIFLSGAMALATAQIVALALHIF